MKINSNVKDALEWLYCIIVAVLLALLLRYYIGTPTIVKQISMYPTLKQNERLILNRFSVKLAHNEIKRGDIVTFEAPSKTYITSYEADLEEPIALYENNPKGIFNKFTYYVLELNKKSYIKRVIALPGEHVKVQNGKVYINGELLEEDYLQDNVVTDDAGGPFVDIIVPEGTVFLMGDNRMQSTDCRRFGCIPLEKIEGKVWIRFWPLNLFGKVE